MKTIKTWLQTQEPYTLHKPVISKFKRNHYNVYGIDHLWEIDLCDMSMYKTVNDGVTFLLTVIDVFSKYAWVKGLKNKTAQSATNAFREILNESGRKPLVIQCDRGLEFNNSTFKSMLTSRNIKLQFPLTTSKFKCAVIEAFNKTLKGRMFKYFTLKGENHRRYIDVLPKLVAGYNNTVHGTIKMKPSEVQPKDAKYVYEQTHAKHRREKDNQPKLNIGDYVRVIKKKPAFEHGYTEKWTREIFQIVKCDFIYRSTAKNITNTCNIAHI